MENIYQISLNDEEKALLAVTKEKVQATVAECNV
jgi:hypothetical protein